MFMEAIVAGFAANAAPCGDTGATRAIYRSLRLAALPKEIAADRRVLFVTRRGDN